MTSKTKPAKPKLKIKKTRALEVQLKLALTTIWLVLFGMLLWIMSLLSLTILLQNTVLTVIFVPLAFLFRYFYQKVITPFYSLTNLVEAVRLEDYSLRIKDHYQAGILHTLSQEVSALANDLQQRKQAYDQHTLLIYHLIEQLETPIAIFNNQLQLSHANDAFSQYIEQPWQSKRLTLSKKLGLIFKNGWHFKQPQERERWQIKTSKFVEHEQTYHLVILTNVEALLRGNQQKSWQQIIRVWGHEIRNSLTPIKSLAQTLLSIESTGSKSKQVLQVIIDRSISLQEFVNRYDDINKSIVVNKSSFDTSTYVETLIALFPDNGIVVNNNVRQIVGDVVLLKQVLINLLKNAIEASNENSKAYITLTLSLQIKRNQKCVVIEVTDNGHGIANMDNIFVPFYTTKEQGQGIGLALSQNIIEQHGGRLTLLNNKNKQGVTARVILPQ